MEHVTAPLVPKAGSVAGGQQYAARQCWRDAAPVLTVALLGAASCNQGFAQDAGGLKVTGDWTNYASYQAEGQEDGRTSLGGKLTVAGTYPLGSDSGWSLGVQLEAGFGRALTEANSVVLAPTNVGLLTPVYGEAAVDVTYSLTKKFTRGGSLTFGKLNLVDTTTATPLVEGGGREGFQHLQLATPMTVFSPPVAFGALMSVPIGRNILTGAILHPDNSSGRALPTRSLDDGLSGFVGVTVPLTIGGQPGFQGLKLIWTTRNQLDFGDTALILVPGAEFGETDGGTAVQYTFQQYIVSNPAVRGAGWGVFGQATVWSEDSSPVDWAASLGITGTSPIKGRSNDRFGFGVFTASPNDDLIIGLAPIFSLEEEDGAEAFYTFALIGSLRVTVNAQMVDPAIKEADDIVTIGLRARVTF